MNRSLSRLSSPTSTSFVNHKYQAPPNRCFQWIGLYVLVWMASSLTLIAQDPAPATPANPSPASPSPASPSAADSNAEQPPAETPSQPPTDAPQPAAPPVTGDLATEQKNQAAASEEKTAQASDEAQPAPASGSGLVDFQRDVAPLLSKRCLECHGPKQAKNDFRVDDPEILVGYIEAGDSSNSSLVNDYLITSDPDSLMPPASHGGPLPTADIALLKLWIDEGAVWPAGATVVAAGEAGEAKPVPAANKVIPSSLAARLWAFQGFFHPATVHFPIALLLVGALAAAGSYLPGWTSAEPIAKFCLFFGAIFAVLACFMGWSFATERGYGNWTSTDGEIFWHRWSGIILAIFSVVLMLLSWKSNRSGNTKHIWKLGMLLAAVIVGLVGHQGGELTYGKAMYDRAFEYLLGEKVGEKPADKAEK